MVISSNPSASILAIDESQLTSIAINATDNGSVIIDHKTGEIIHLVASVSLSVWAHGSYIVHQCM